MGVGSRSKNLGTAASSRSGSGSSDKTAANSEMLAELAAKSPHLAAMQQDLAHRRGEIDSWAKRVVNFNGSSSSMAEVAELVDDITAKLASLSDSVGVLRRFGEWPAAKFEAMEEVVQWHR
jgi:hypothetical protein